MYVVLYNTARDYRKNKPTYGPFVSAEMYIVLYGSTNDHHMTADTAQPKNSPMPPHLPWRVGCGHKSKMTFGFCSREVVLLTESVVNNGGEIGSLVVCECEVHYIVICNLCTTQ